MNQMNQFKVGETVVHSSHGVGTVEGVEERNFNGNLSRFYVLKINDAGAIKTVFVPMETAGQRLRRPMPRETLDRVYSILIANQPNHELDHQTWNRRYRDYMERIATGDPIQVAEVLVSLRVLARQQDLSFGERKLFDQARELLMREIAAVENLKPELIQLIQEAFS